MFWGDQCSLIDDGGVDDLPTAIDDGSSEFGCRQVTRSTGRREVDGGLLGDGDLPTAIDGDLLLSDDGLLLSDDEVMMIGSVVLR